MQGGSNILNPLRLFVDLRVFPVVRLHQFGVHEQGRPVSAGLLTLQDVHNLLIELLKIIQVLFDEIFVYFEVTLWHRLHLDDLSR